MTYNEALTVLKKYGQEHVLNNFDSLDIDKQKSLLESVSKIDFELMKRLYDEAVSSAKETEAPDVSPIPYTDVNLLTDSEKETLTKSGEDIIKKGRFAAVTMAGGQGTRLGYDGPKGTYQIGLPGGNTLFELQLRRLQKESEKCGRAIPWYIMTSRENDDATRKFFEENNYFGYSRNDIIFFVQKMLPMIGFDGKIVLDAPGHIKEGADGHGGIFAAMISSGVYDDMKKRGIKWIFVGGIDNVLLKLCDPLFIGFSEKCGLPACGKSLVKRDAHEGVGIFCKSSGKPTVIEYTEISDEMAEAVNEKGEFIYGDAHILCNMFNICAFDYMAGNAGLPYHVARKKTKFVDADGNVVTPEKPNAFKFEAFIFDAFSYFDDIGILRVNREDEFAPVKNKEGQDSPDTARALYLDAYKRGKA